MPAPKMRPGICLLDDERHVATLGDAIDTLEMLQAPNPRPDLEHAIGQIKFVRRQLAERAASELARLNP